MKLMYLSLGFMMLAVKMPAFAIMFFIFAIVAKK